MKSKFQKLYVFFLLIMTVMIDISAYSLSQDSTLNLDKVWLISYCTTITLVVLILNFIYLKMIDVRISSCRINYASRCFASYFTKEALKERGNWFMSFYYACVSSRYFFLKTFKACK